jgi:hypothetical protein
MLPHGGMHDRGGLRLEAHGRLWSAMTTFTKLSQQSSTEAQTLLPQKEIGFSLQWSLNQKLEDVIEWNRKGYQA